MALDRRTVLAAGAAAPLVFATGTGHAATAQTKPAGFAALPLPFEPGQVGWLSDKIIVSHHDNNYAGAVKRLATIRDQFAALDVATAPSFTVNGLKREELIAWNSMILHEIYFAGLSGTKSPSRELAKAIERDFGSQARWAAEFAAMGKALGGGSGWVLLTWSPRERRLVNQWAADHTMTLAGATPVLALDMYEHAYAMDFGAKAGAYVDAFMKGSAWTYANATFTRVAG